jgi:hypothetical protein
MLVKRAKRFAPGGERGRVMHGRDYRPDRPMVCDTRHRAEKLSACHGCHIPRCCLVFRNARGSRSVELLSWTAPMYVLLQAIPLGRQIVQEIRT